LGIEVGPAGGTGRPYRTYGWIWLVRVPRFTRVVRVPPQLVRDMTLLRRGQY